MKRNANEQFEIPFNPGFAAIDYMDLSEESKPSITSSLFQPSMPYNKRKRSYTRASGTRINQGAATLAKAIDAKMKLKRRNDAFDAAIEEAKLMTGPIPADYVTSRIRGRGLYNDRGLYGRGAFSLGDAEALGNRFLTKGLPSMMNAGSKIAKFFGRGAYENDTAMNETIVGSDNRSAQISSAGDETGSICITNREYIGDLFGPATSGTFDISSFPLNPGLEQTFPWLSQLAANYEEYEFIQLVFEFKSTVQDINSSNGQVGTVISATNYNAAQPVFTDKPSMVAYYGSNSSKSTDNFIHGVECDPAKLSGAEAKFVRTNPVLTGEDLKSYDHGTFQIATHNIPGTVGSATNPGLLNATLGELYCNYKIMLRKPKFLTGRGLAITRATFCSNGGETGANLLGTSLLTGQQNNLKVIAEMANNQLKFTFPAYFAGTVEIKVLVEGAALGGDLHSAGDIITGNVSTISDIYAVSGGLTETPDFQFHTTSAGSAILIEHIRLQPATNAVNNTIIIPCTMGGVINQTWIDITEYNYGFNKPSDNSIVFVNSAGIVTIPFKP